MKITLDFRDIEYISSIAKHQSISVAAKELMITQPALSIFLNNFENRLGIKPFIKVGNKFVLTYAGECILRDGASILSIRDRLQLQLEDIREMRTGRLRVGCSNIRGMSLFGPAVKRFKLAYPNVKLLLYEEDAENLEDDVLAGNIDLAFFNCLVPNDLLDYDLITRDPIVMYCSHDSDIAKQACTKNFFDHPWIDLQNCKDEAFIKCDEHQATYQITKNIFEDFGFLPTIEYSLKNQITAVNMAARGCGLFIGPKFFYLSCPANVDPCLLSFGRDVQYTLDFVGAWRNQGATPKLIEYFVECVKAIYS